MLGPVVVDLAGPRLTAADRARLRHPLVGMVILFSRNYESAEQLKELCAQLHDLRDPPLLIAVDHEGGRVQRFRGPPFTRLPPMNWLGRLWDHDVLSACRVAVSLGYVLAAELRAHGVDFSFTPVLDLDHGRSAIIGDRALHHDPRTVTMLANHLCHGLALAGMTNCGKHFPGHGWAAADSHVDLPRDGRARRALVASDAAPYRWLGAALSAVMPAHVVYPRVDAMPAGFSRRWLQDILRGELGFTGAIFSDDLSMEGAKAGGDVVARAQCALDAGCDFVLVCNDADAADRVLDGIRWTQGGEFAQRFERLRPCGAAPDARRLFDSALYRVASADLRLLAQIGEAFAFT
jgi:beta-N-acetylhexosaminidase